MPKYVAADGVVKFPGSGGVTTYVRRSEVLAVCPRLQPTQGGLGLVPGAALVLLTGGVAANVGVNPDEAAALLGMAQAMPDDPGQNGAMKLVRP